LRKPLSVIYFAPSNFGALDAFAPVISEIHHRFGNDATIDAIYWGVHSEQRIAPSQFHVRLLEQRTKLHRVAGPARLPRLVRQVYRLLYVLALLCIRFATHRRRIVISSTVPKKAAEISLFKFLGQLYRSRFFQFPSIQAPINDKLAERFSEDGMAHRDRMREQPFAKEKYKTWLPANRICFLNSEIELIENSQAWTERNHTPKHFTPIGLPRLFPGWQKDLETIGKPIIEDELKRLGLPADTNDLIVVVLTIPEQKHFTDNKRQFYDLLDELIISVRKRYPDNPIILKEKPVGLGVGLYEDLRVHYANDGVFLSGCALSALGLRAKIAFSIQESSGLYDLATMGIPAIEYARYNDAWLAGSPWGSANSGEPGMEMAFTRERLDELIAMVSEEQFPNLDHRQFGAHIGHADNLDMILGPHSGAVKRGTAEHETA
jgi:hypothetical protein